MAKERFDTRTGRATDVLEPAMAATGEFAQEAKKKAPEVAPVAEGIAYARECVQEWASEEAKRVDRAAKTIAADATELIRKYPVPALLVGVGIGFCLSRALRNWE